MTDDEIVAARADIETPMPSPEPIVLTWEEWQASRTAKRALLAQLGLAGPSRRRTAPGSQEKRLRKAFCGQRVPELTGERCAT